MYFLLSLYISREICFYNFYLFKCRLCLTTSSFDISFSCIFCVCNIFHTFPLLVRKCFLVVFHTSVLVYLSMPSFRWSFYFFLWFPLSFCLYVHHVSTGDTLYFKARSRFYFGDWNAVCYASLPKKLNSTYRSDLVVVRQICKGRSLPACRLLCTL